MPKSVTLKIPLPELDAIDEAREEGESRSKAIRRLCAQGLHVPQSTEGNGRLTEVVGGLSVLVAHEAMRARVLLAIRQPRNGTLQSLRAFHMADVLRAVGPLMDAPQSRSVLAAALSSLEGDGLVELVPLGGDATEVDRGFALSVDGRQVSTVVEALRR